MSWMFSGCKNLKVLNLSNFDTNKVIDMSDMFYGCSSLNTITVNNNNNGIKEQIKKLRF